MKRWLKKTSQNINRAAKGVKNTAKKFPRAVRASAKAYRSSRKQKKGFFASIRNALKAGKSSMSLS